MRNSLLLIMMFLAGCAAMYSTNIASPEKFAGYKEGVTTKQQIRNDLGEPASTVNQTGADCDSYYKQSDFTLKSITQMYCYDSNGALKSKTSVQ